MAVNLATLPEIHFANADASEIEAKVMAAYEKASGVTLQPGDPVRLFLESLSYVLSVQNSLIDLAGRQNLLAYAEGAALDHLGALMGVARIPAQPARCEMRFSLAEPLAFAVPIPKGCRIASEDGKIMFATEVQGEIAAGETFCDIACLCTEAGAAASGLLPGQITKLVDPLPYVASVSNITETYDGSAIEADDRLRERIRLAPESFTVAGSSGAYKARTLEVSSDIQSVAVITPEPGVVDVRFVLDNGELPDQAMCELVAQALNAETVRPLTDQVLAQAPDVVEYEIQGSWYISEEDASLFALVSARVEQALQKYIAWQRQKPGRDINPSKLIELLMAAGAKRVVLTKPEFTQLSAIEIARETAYDLEFGGVEDE